MTAKYVFIHCVECGRNRRHEAHGLCKRCYNHQWREDHLEYQRQWGEKNREHKAEYNRRWREANPEHKKEYDSQWRKAHAEYSGQWHEANPEYNRQWAEANREKRREQEHRYRARKNGAAVGPVNEAAVYELYNRTCVYCGATQNLTLDHVVALADGGTDCQDNLVVACRRCNSSKRAKSLEDWLQTQPRANAWLY